MDSVAVQTGGAMGIGTFVVIVLYRVYKAMNHKTFRVRCGTRLYEFSFDIDEPVNEVNATPQTSNESSAQNTQQSTQSSSRPKSLRLPFRVSMRKLAIAPSDTYTEASSHVTDSGSARAPPILATPLRIEQNNI